LLRSKNIYEEIKPDLTIHAAKIHQGIGGEEIVNDCGNSGGIGEIH